MRLQLDNEFQQVKIKDLNYQNNIEMFKTSAREGKAFAAEQKIRELKTRISKLNALKLKISSTKIILNSAINMNNVPSEKYGLTPEEIEKNPFQMKDLEQFSICIGQKEQNLLMIDQIVQ